MTGHIQVRHFAPDENAGHVQVGDGKVIAGQILAPGQRIVEDSERLSQQQLVAFGVRRIAGRFGQQCAMLQQIKQQRLYLQDGPSPGFRAGRNASVPGIFAQGRG
jgi:hypothetical protein